MIAISYIEIKKEQSNYESISYLHKVDAENDTSYVLSPFNPVYK